MPRAQSSFTLIAVFAMLVSAPVAGAEYTLMIYESPSELARRSDASTDGQAYWSDYAAVGEAFKSAGVLRGGAALGSLDGTSAAPARPASDMGGPRLGGYFVIDVADTKTALAWSQQIPAVMRGGRVEVYPAWPAPAMR